MTAFDLIRDNNISAVPAINADGKVVGCVSARDVRLLVSSTKIYKVRSRRRQISP